MSSTVISLIDTIFYISQFRSCSELWKSRENFQRKPIPCTYYSKMELTCALKNNWALLRCEIHATGHYDTWALIHWYWLMYFYQYSDPAGLVRYENPYSYKEKKEGCSGRRCLWFWILITCTHPGPGSLFLFLSTIQHPCFAPLFQRKMSTSHQLFSKYGLWAKLWFPPIHISTNL
jgi:hypothetical protein